ncbi:uncharacterized protein LOC114283306 [Camellia sinensis]|uniref:uncharacterized protein LOC114283306 n=1 Tax=Camellia sinensis TaxID=4442 RepID=UPI0010363E32|nr:uncharacterized protein LOC114283306 [Camellia sinensis]
MKNELVKSWGHKGASSTKLGPKGAIWRAAAMAATGSASYVSGEARNRTLLKEAKETLQMGKLLGVNYKGNEEVVLSRIMDLEETKKASLSDKEIKDLWARDRLEFMTVDAEGSAGGLLCIWDPGMFQCIGGDFNEITNIGERKGCSRREREMKELNDFIDKSEVNDLPLLGRRYTWCNAREGEKWSRIDRVLVDPKWLESFNLKLWGLPRVLSDHSPLLLMEDERDWGPRPFRFINAWTLHSNFLPFVEKWWTEQQVEGWAGFRLFQKLKGLKITLKQWNCEVFGNVNTKLKQVQDELHMFDLVAEERELEEVEKARRREARAEACRLTRMVDWLWLQKSRLNWNLNGDKSTRYFHVTVKCRQGRNEINSLTIGDVVIDDPCKVKQGVHAHFQKQFTEVWKCRPLLEGPFQSVRESPYFDKLESEFSEEEIWSAVKGCDGNRAPGPDGFNLTCF